MVTIQEKKRDLKSRLLWHGVQWEKIEARTVSFEGFGYGRCVFLTVYNPVFPANVTGAIVTQTVPKPSQGGYCTEFKTIRRAES